MVANRINHVVLGIDGSLSMAHLTPTVIKVADNLVAYLAERSKVWDQETRITVYVFNTKVECLIFDKDVLRMPSIAGMYHATGATALMDATGLAIDDLSLTMQKYGEHSFLIYMLTDGQENSSRKFNPARLSAKIDGLDDNWTLATFVPNQTAVFDAKKFGFPAPNISIWDTTSSVGLEKVGEVLRNTTETYFEARSQGLRGTKTLFNLKTVSTHEIQSTLKPLSPTLYSLCHVMYDSRADNFMYDILGRQWEKGKVFYQLTKKELIQGYKEIAISMNNKVYTGQDARRMLGLPDYDVDVVPTAHPGYTIFVQSTAPNRKLLANTNVLILR